MSWDDFEGAKNKTSLSQVKRRILSRELAGNPKTGAAISKEKRIAKMEQKVAELLFSLQEKVRLICTTNRKYFPRIRINNLSTSDADRETLVVVFEASEEHALSRQMTVFLRLTLVDSYSQVVRIEAAAGTSVKDIDRATPARKNFYVVYTGVFDARKMSELLEVLLFDLMDQAQEDAQYLPDLAKSRASWLVPSRSAGKELRA